MDLNGLRLFTRVVELGSLTRAAAELGVTTSSVSRALARLEAALGVRLLQRTTRKLGLTAAGRDYVEQIRAALALVEEANVAATGMSAEPRGSVRMTAPPPFAAVTLPFIGEFLRKHPKVRVELSFSQQILDLVGEGFDLALRSGHLRDSSLVARPIGRLRVGLFASREYVRRRGRPRSPDDLARHDCVLLRSRGGKATWHLSEGVRRESVDVGGPLEVDDIPSLHQAVLAGIGIGGISLLASAAMRGLVRILPSYLLSDVPVSLVWPSRRLEPACVTLLREFLAPKLASLPWGFTRSHAGR